MAQIYYTSTNTTISCQLINITANDRYSLNMQVLWSLSGVGTLSDSFGYEDVASSGVTFSNLSPGTTYELTATLYANGTAYNTYSTYASTTGSGGGTGGGTTTYPQPLINLTPSTNTITVTVSNMLAGYNKTLAVYVGGQYYNTFTGLINSYGSFYITGLTANTTYYIVVYVYYDGSSTPLIAEGYVTTSSATSTRPNSFAWTFVKKQGEKFNLTATEWNALIANVNAVRNYKGLASYNCTYAQTGSVFYASIYNDVARAINGLYAALGYLQPISEVSSGSVITADCINLLMLAINRIT